MLTIERPSFMGNKFLVGSTVFIIGFLGTLSLLQAFGPSLDQLASGRERISVFRPGSPEATQTQSRSENKEDNKSESDEKSKSPAAVEVKPIAAEPVGSPAPGQAAQATAGPSSPVAGSGTVKVSGQVAPASQPTSTAPAPVPTTVTHPSAPSPVVSQPSAPAPSAPTQPVTSLTQPVTDTAGNLLPSLCPCGW